MNNISLMNQQLSEVVKHNFRMAAVFEKYNLDFCCRGNKSITDACKEKGINPDLVKNDLTRIENNLSDQGQRFAAWDADFLVDYIVNNHHKFVREMIPVISAHTEKVASVHGSNHPETIKVAKVFSVVYKDLKQHMMKEEQILFPYIKQLMNAKRNNSKSDLPYFGTVKNPIKLMQAEHESAGDAMYEIRELTNNYTAPEDACNTYKVCYEELKAFEDDLHKHIHLENNILFPAAVDLENEIHYFEKKN